MQEASLALSLDNIVVPFPPASVSMWCHSVCTRLSGAQCEVIYDGGGVLITSLCAYVQKR